MFSSRYIILFLILLMSNNAFTKNLPRYEFGIFGGAGSIEDYPSADHSSFRYLLFPAFIYRGDVVRTDRGGASANFFKTESLLMDLSFGASFPASSKNNEAREGMSDLDWLGEIGPRLTLTIIKSDDRTLKIMLPVRYVFSTNFKHTQERGYRLSPQLSYRFKNSALIDNQAFFASIAFNTGSQLLQDYFFSVAEEFKTEERKSYRAKSGYMGTNIFAGSAFSIKDLTVFTGIQYKNYKGSANQNSPLFKREENMTFILGFSYFFHKSKKTIHYTEDENLQ